MISLYSGTPGSGKSLHVATRIYYTLRAGRPVIANFPVNVGLIARGRRRCGPFLAYDNEKLNPDLLIDFSASWFRDHRFREETILLVIDEAQLMFNARSWDARDRSGWVSFFSQHRKYGYSIVLIAQFDRMLDRQIRSLLEYEYIHRKVSNFGVWGRIFSVVALGKLFVAVKMWYPLHEKVGADWYAAKKRYYQIYDTYSTFGLRDPGPPEVAVSLDPDPDSGDGGSSPRRSSERCVPVIPACWADALLRPCLRFI